MLDDIADFPLRGAEPSQLSSALARSFAEFNSWHSQSVLLAGFVQDAVAGGVSRILLARLLEGFELLTAEGVIVGPNTGPEADHDIVKQIAVSQLTVAERGVSVAAIVMLHNGCERLLWRLVRFGLVSNRQRAVGFISKRPVTVGTLVSEGADAAIDGLLERWWARLERDTLVAKWDRLTGLVGFPKSLHNPPWHFDRDMLLHFDRVRQDAVHHAAKDLEAFDLAAFAGELWRAQLVWVVRVASVLGIRLVADTLFTGK